MQDVPENTDHEMKLWFLQAAEEWVDALPVGNGRLGAMVFGGTGRERLQLNEDTLWDGYARDRARRGALEALSEVRRLIFEGRNIQATELAEREMMGDPPTVKSYQSLGDLYIDFGSPRGSARASDYCRSLDLDTGIAETIYELDGVRYVREVFASAPDNVIVVRIQADKSDSIDCSMTMTRQQDASCITEGGSTLILRGQVQCEHHETGENAGMRFEAKALARATGGELSGCGGCIDIKRASEVLLLIAGATSYGGVDEVGGDPATLCQAVLSRACVRAYQDLRDAHINEHRRLFRRVKIDLGAGNNTHLPTDRRITMLEEGHDDPELVALFFQMGRYLLMSSSRPGCLPANLQGIWCEDMKAPWNSDFHTNINVQMNYWAADVANLGECHLPLFDYMANCLVKSGRETARRHYDCRGWVVHHLSDVWGKTTPADGVWGIWPVGAAWLCRHPYEHYLFTGDKDFLARRGYPLMREGARFILDFLVEAPEDSPVAGRLVTNPSHSPENTFRKADGTRALFTYAATGDLQIVHDLFTSCIEASRVLGTDAEFRNELEAALKRLAPIQISAKTGRIQEWVEDYDEPEPGHRHTAHLYGLHPGRQITMRGTPELFAAARKVLEQRLQNISDENRWSGGRIWHLSLWARLLDGEMAYEALMEVLRGHLSKSMLTLCWDHRPPFQIDANFGGTAGIAEVLLQSHTGELHLLPCLPRAWSEGSVKGLHGRGGFEVDMRWKDCELTEAVIHSIIGGGMRRALG